MLHRIVSFLLLTTLSSVAYTHFEPRQQHPITLTPDGKKLLALHSTAHSLSVFDVGNPQKNTPLLIAEISVASAPVSVKARTNDEVWVVNEAADSVSIVSLSQGVVIDTLRVGDEPADICFANGKAFITCSQKRVIAVFEATTRAPLADIAINGATPRAMVANADGSKLYVACLYSGNRTTILPQHLAPAQPAPANPALPAAPKVGVIVAASDPRITWNVLDHDIAEIDTTSQQLSRWLGDVGTHLFDLAVHSDGSLWCANSESLNLTRFEPALNGQFSQHRLSRIDLTTNSKQHYDLNPGITRATIPQPASIAVALAQPSALAFSADGNSVWITAFQSDRVAEINATTGAILKRVDLRPSGAGTEQMRGPRALVVADNRVYVLNKIADSLATIDRSTGNLLSDIPLGSFDPMPTAIRAGRGVLYDARLSGNGTVSCATCHLDADRDGLAWDLGDPSGAMVSVPSADLSVHDFAIINRSLHPMKGPLVTQTLRGLASNDADSKDPTDNSTRPASAIVTKFHWRGDKPSIQSFNSTFPNLMGGVPQSAQRMDELAAYLLSIVHHPNPNRNLDRSLRTNLAEGNALKGRDIFNDHVKSHCIVCHNFNAGTDQNLDMAGEVDRFQPMKNPSLRTVYQRQGIYNPTAGADSLSGFGLGSDGSGFAMPIVHPYSLDSLDKPPLTSKKLTDLANLTAFLLSFDTDTAPAATYDMTFTAANKNAATSLSSLGILETQSAESQSGLVAWGRIAGVLRRYRWNAATSRYLTDNNSSPLTRSALLAMIGNGDALTFSGVLAEEAAWRSTDRNSNGILDEFETRPVVSIQRAGSTWQLRWPIGDWYPESSSTLSNWQPAAGNARTQESFWTLDLPVTTQPRHFYRLIRTW